MSEAAIRTQVHSILSGVADIGKVYDYERWANDWATFINLFKTTVGGVDQIRGWEISRGSVKDEGKPGRFEATHSYAIKGYIGVKDSTATEKTFAALIEAIRAAFRTNWNLNGAAEYHDLIQVPVSEPRMFGSILCHYAELTLDVHDL